MDLKAYRYFGGEIPETLVGVFLLKVYSNTFSSLTEYKFIAHNYRLFIIIKCFSCTKNNVLISFFLHLTIQTGNIPYPISTATRVLLQAPELKRPPLILTL